MNYYAQTQYISNSNLTELKKMLFNIPDPPRQAYSFGSLVDAMLTEPELVDYQEKTLLDSFDNEIRFEPEEWHTAIAMVQKLKANPMIKLLLSQGDSQCIKMLDNFEPYGVPVRCKLDFHVPKMKLGADLKTTTCKTQTQFYNSLATFDYDRQGAWYMDIMGLDKFSFIGISKHKPYDIFTYSCVRGDEFYLRGKAKYEWLLERYIMLILPLL
jgi:hypothetical protein